MADETEYSKRRLYFMPLKEIKQPEIINIDEKLRLRILNKDNWSIALPWYQNAKVLYYSEGVTDKVYDMDMINRMYTYLEAIGELYFIELLENDSWKLIGDVTLSEENMPIVIGEEKYWSGGIGRKVIGKLIERAKVINLNKICVPQIYHYNESSRILFKSMGFVKVAENDKEESYELILK